MRAIVNVARDRLEMREMLATPGGRLSVADDLLMGKVQERMVQIAKGEAPPAAEPGSAPDAVPAGEAAAEKQEVEAEVSPENPGQEEEAAEDSGPA